MNMNVKKLSAYLLCATLASCLTAANLMAAEAPVARLIISQSHLGSFQQGNIGDTYTLTVSNVGTAPTTGAVTVNDTLPAGLTATAISGTG